MFLRTLRGDPDLGKLVQNLRLEGGYGKDLPAVFDYLSNLHSLSIKCHILAKESNVGLIRILPSLKPARLFITDLGQPNKKSAALQAALFAAMSGWQSLVSTGSVCESDVELKSSVSPIRSKSPSQTYSGMTTIYETRSQMLSWQRLPLKSLRFSQQR